MPTPPSAQPPIDRILYTAEQVDQRIRAIAADISDRYRGRDLKLIGVLKGSVFFLTQLARHLDIPVKIDFLAISSFAPHRPTAPGIVRIAKDLDEPIEGENVLIVEDIVDTGLTMRYLLQTLAGRGPDSLAICTLLDRTCRRIAQIPVEFRGFEIGDHFVVGCGLDHRQYYRNLPFLAVLKQDRR